MKLNSQFKLNKMINEKTIVTQQRVDRFVLKTVKKIK